MTKAHRSSVVASDEIYYIVAHRTVAPLNDATETCCNQGSLRRPAHSYKGQPVGAAGIDAEIS